MARKINRMKAAAAVLLSAFMVLGAVAVAPMMVLADTPRNIQVTHVGNGTAEADSGTTQALPGNTVLLRAVPAAGATFTSWEVVSGGVSILPSTSATDAFFVMTSGDEDVHIRAVFAGGNQLLAPTGLRVENNVLHWIAVDNAVNYRVYAVTATGETNVANPTTNFWQIDLAQFPQGTNVRFYVSAESHILTNSPRSSGYAWTAIDATLPTPVISVGAGNILTWTGVGAQFVRVYRGGTAIWESDAAVTQVDLAALNLPTGSQNIQIRFLAANGDIASNLSNTVSVNLTGQLPAPTGVAISGATLTWTAVPNAVGYRIYVAGVARTTTAITGTEFNLATLALAAGNHNVQVRALGNGTTTLNSALSTGVNFTPGAVGVPANVNITGTTLSWTAVSNAVGYRVYVDGEARTTEAITTTTFNLVTLGLAVGTYEIQVRALGDGTTTHNSNLSPAVTFNMTVIQLAAPANVRLQGNNVLHWDAVPNAVGYTIYLNGTAHPVPTMATHFALGALPLPAGVHQAQVRADGDGTTTQNSPLSVSVPFTVAGLPPGELPSIWAREYVETAVAVGIVPENLRALFTQATTRAEFAALATALYETVMQYTILERMEFNDTTDVNVQKMGARGVVQGVGEGYFDPHAPLTREQAATMIARLAAAMGNPLPAVAATFPDNADISYWAMTAVGQVQAAGIMIGVDGGLFMP
ncbi:MAG: S-layer homology domain-containing protein, partial [Clostridiales bacterium]|nr:S-layer homology domain-containing protein [Clostridiales bacterium]